MVDGGESPLGCIGREVSLGGVGVGVTMGWEEGDFFFFQNKVKCLKKGSFGQNSGIARGDLLGRG